VNWRLAAVLAAVKRPAGSRLADKDEGGVDHHDWDGALI
jgi:hypothetical protein